ncbi:hypothetical protein DYI20_06125 [Auritidibacter ignavus]|nr:hypothetical protein DYI20_06125 [Auritidibacter ignavus]
MLREQSSILPVVSLTEDLDSLELGKTALGNINILELVSPSNVFVLILRRWSDAQIFHGHVRSGVVVRKIVLRVCGSHVTDRCAEQLSGCLKIIRGSS